MNQHLQSILQLFESSVQCTDEQKAALLKYVKAANKELDITAFKLDRTDKIKMTTEILLEETIRELEDKRKAVEDQNRELGIESSLERVRSVALSMSKPDDMLAVCRIIAEQMQHLGVTVIRNVQTAIFYKEKGVYINYEFYARHDKVIITEVDYKSHDVQRNFAENMLKGDNAVFTHSFKGPEIQEWLEYQKTTNVFIDHHLENGNSLDYYWYSLGPVALGLSTYKPLLTEEQNLFRRFLKVFELAYRRYLDIEKAEAQAKEAQIELALERIRARTMAMQRSDELSETAYLLYLQFQELRQNPEQLTIGIIHEAERTVELWLTMQGGRMNDMVQVSIDEPYVISKVYAAWKEQKKSLMIDISGEELKKYNQYRNKLKNGLNVENDRTENRRVINFAFFSRGQLSIASPEPLSGEGENLLLRFAKVFEQTYTRFLDLQRAEIQVKEAQIESAMEKVRSRALAMQKPGELVEVARLLRKEMNLLGVEELETSSIYIHHEDKGKTECWYAIKDIMHPDKEPASDHMIMDLSNTWVGRKMLTFYHSAEKKTSISMQGEHRKEWINYCAACSNVLKGFYGDEIPDRIYHLYKFPGGYMGAASPGDISPESWDLLQRATAVFSLAYTRFSDLQQAEAQAKEAHIEAALERVRSRTLAMQSSTELAETAAVLFRQLIGLGIEPNRLYIAIINDQPGVMEFWITDEDGTKVGEKFSGNAERNLTFKKMYDGWTEKHKSITIDMHGEELSDYFNHLTELGIPFKQGSGQKRRVQNIAYFSKGFIGMASQDKQSEDSVTLLERFAAVFNLTYTRFHDLQLAEAHAVQAAEDLVKLQTEKKRAEETLTELRETQMQLIQSEKMASLGELTAGIAHEIQNPLNFVNNFSEVSNELIDEMNAEIEKGDIREARAIAEDIKQNLEKINHHGKRADAIVKGMLQHSRTSSAVKEPTDINKLADEYLRLAYHGLRAKDKSFNTTLKTDYDESTGDIFIIPQDIGRVILNLITNAFYAVNEKKLQLPDGYEPLVAVITKNGKDEVEVIVKDNGNGIPNHVLDKIFQPFFTTKPTGQGTGLGLSLAYDIVKAHGGILKVKTEEGKGTAFTIQLPLK